MKQANNSQKQKRSKMPFIIVSIIIAIIILLFSFKACSTPTYTITFKNYDGTIIDVIEVKNGEIPSTNKIPSKPSDDEYEYLFDSWGNIVRANGDATYQAVFINKLINNKEDSDKKIDNKEDDNRPTDKEGLYYYVNFLDDDGTVIEISTFKYGSIPYCTKDIPNKTRDGYLYTFAGWNKTLSRVIGNTTYRATYNKTYVGGGGGGSSEPSVTKYTVSFVLESGQGTAPSNQQVPSGSKATQPSINCGGYIIEHWYEDNAYTTLWDFSTGTITEAKTLYGKWENKYAVTFDYKGKGTNNFVSVANGSTVTKPSDPSYTGYEFITWQYYTESHEVQVLDVYDFASTVNAPLTLYAKWGVKLIYDAQGKGTVNPSSIIVPAGETLSASSVVSPTEIDKYTFDDWYKEPACINRFDTSQAINGPGPITLYAGWDYLVKFDLNGHGSNIVVPVKPGNKISSDSIPDDPTATGYVFKGWYTDNTTFQNSFSFNSNINAPTIIYAKWVEALTVTFDSTGLSSTIDPVTVEAGNKITMPTTTVPSGYAFKGWYKENTYTTQWNFDDPVTANMTLYPKIDIIVSFNLNGHGGDPIPFITVRPGSKITAPSPAPTDDDCTFVDWYKDETLANTVRWDFTTDTVNAPTTLYAKWTVRVNFKYQGKGSDATSVTIIDKTISKPADPTYSGYLFKGWFKDEACTAANKWDFDNDVVTGDTDLYAKWVAVPEKGDTIKLSDGKNYRILKLNNNEALVLSLSNASNSQYWSTSQSVEFDTGVFGAKYEGSTLDTYLENTWYAALDDSEGANKTKQIYDAIKLVDIDQGIYTLKLDELANDNDSYVLRGTGFIKGDGGIVPYYITEGYSPVSVEDRHVYVLGVQDIADYLGKDNITGPNVRSMYNLGTANAGMFWLNSAYYPNETGMAWMIDGNSNPRAFLNYYRYVTKSDHVRPAFVIDLGNSNLDYELTSVDKYTIATAVNDDDMGSVKITGGPRYNTGTEVMLTAKAKSGYMFTKWSDDVTDNPRIVVANATNQTNTYKALFEEKIPTKGDIVILDHKKYRVLSYDGTNGHAKLLSLYDLKTDQKYYETVVATTTIGDYTVAKYDGSDLDIYLNSTWYGSLNSNIKNAIILDTSLKQNMYSISYEDFGGYISTIFTDEGYPGWSTPYQKYLYSNSVPGATITDKKVYAPDFSDIISYLGINNLTINNITKMFHDTDGSNNTVWLRSGVFAISDPTNEYAKECACTTDPFDDYIDDVTETHAVHAMFTINLKATGIEYDLIKVPKYTVTVSADDDSHGSVEGGGTFIEYNEVTVTATPNEGYAFVNWNGDEYDTWNPKTFSIYEDTDIVANFVKMPSKGDVIQLNDEKNYRVLKTDGSKATVVGQYSLDQKAYATSPQTTTFGGATGIDFYDSTLYSYVSNWLNNVLWGDETTRPMYYGMDSVDVIQGLYSYHNGSPADDNYAVRGMKTNGDSYYLTGGVTGDDYLAWSRAYPLDISHFASYLGEDNLTKNNINNMLFGSNDSTVSLWLTSADGNSSSNALYYDASNGVISSDVASATHDVYPAFIIDLTSSGVEYDIVSEASKHTITVASNDDDMGTVRMTGGPKFIDGTEVLLTAKPKSGYKFVKWKIDGTDDVSADKNNATRYITVSADKTYTAVFEFAIPSKGEIIKVGDKRYRVLDTNNNNVFLLALFNASDSQVFNSNGSNVYANSELDTYLNTTWYDTLSDTMKTAIGDGTIGLKQHSYHWNSGTPSDDNYVIKGTYGSSDNYYITEVSSEIKDIGDRYVFALDVQDVADYLGKYNLSKENTTSMFNIGASDIVWLRSASSGNSTDAWNVNGNYGNLYDFGVINANAVHPSFWINLLVTGYEYDTEATKYTISVQTSDADMGSVSGGGIIYKGGVTTISATPIEGYRFVKWDDGNTENPRIVIGTANKTYTAEFDEAETASHGDVIMFGTDEDHKYRVLKLDGNKALVVAYFDGDKIPYWENEAQTTGSFADPSLNGVKYDGSKLDTYLNTTWLGNQTSDLQDAIVEKTNLLQRIFKKENTDPTTQNPPQILVTKGENTDSSNYYISSSDSYDSVNVGDRNVFALDLQDIVDYFDGDIVTSDKLKAVFGYQPGYKFWLRSAVTPDESSAWTVDGQVGVYEPCIATNDSEVYARPAFYVDLSKIEFKVDNDIQGYQITVSSNDESMGTASSSSENCNEGATVTISATPKSGCKFVNWDDGVKTNPRTVVVTGNMNYTAVFADIEYPNKGQIINVDNKRFRILSIDDSHKALVLGLDAISNGLKYYQEVDAPDANINTYDGSDLDLFLCNWYDSLDSDSSLKKGIVAASGLEQSILNVVNGTPTDGDPDVIAKGIDSTSSQYYIKDNNNPVNLSGDRYVFALDAKDVINYFGDVDITSEGIKEMYDNTDDHQLWLRSGAYSETQTNLIVYINLENGRFEEGYVELPKYVHPSFYIDLSLISTEFDIEQPAP